MTQNKNGMFLVQTLNVERVVLSPKYIEEINSKVPEGTLDMVEGLREVGNVQTLTVRNCRFHMTDSYPSDFSVPKPTLTSSSGVLCILTSARTN